MIINAATWAQETFAECDLNDKRLTTRVIKIATQLAENIGSSLAKSCMGNEAATEGAYRFIRNNKVKGYAIANGAFKATAKKISANQVVLALEDTTSFAFQHNAKTELGDLGGPKNAVSRGFHAHSTLIVDPSKDYTVGLIYQKIWRRDPDARGETPDKYLEKESYKWEEASRHMQGLLNDKMSTVISVCDREADLYEYLRYKTNEKQRFIVRARHNRKQVDAEQTRIFDCVNSSETLGEYQVNIMQKANRKARVAKVSLKSAKVTINMPGNKKADNLDVNIVLAQEINTSKNIESLRWIILTTEDVSTFKSARLVTQYYEKRWHIEEYHKAWKTGCGAEEQRMQSADNLERMIVILGTIAVRLLQLRESIHLEKHKDMDSTPATQVLTRNELIVLWCFINSQKTKNKKQTRLPKVLPNLKWVYEAIAKLGGWTNTKRTGIASWLTIWAGWFRLQERLAGFEVAQNV